MGFETVTIGGLRRDPRTGQRRAVTGLARVVVRCDGCGRPCGPHDTDALARAAAQAVAWELDDAHGKSYCATCRAQEPRPVWSDAAPPA